MQELWDLLDVHPIFPSEGYRNEIKDDLKKIFGAIERELSSAKKRFADKDGEGKRAFTLR